MLRAKRIAICIGLCAIVLLSGNAFFGCGESAKAEKSKHARYIAMGINDGATPRIPGQSLCPVCGEPIVPDYHTTSTDARVYFCCQDCLDEFKADPSWYEAKLAEQEGEEQLMGPPDSYEEEEETQESGE